MRYLAVFSVVLLVPPRQPSSALSHDGAYPPELGFSFVSWRPRLLPEYHIYIFFVGFPLNPSPPVAHDGPDDPTAPAAYIDSHDGAQLVSLLRLLLLLLLLLGIC